jgi:hypothetical protein
MSKTEELKAEVEKLRTGELAEFVKRPTGRDWERWDQEIEADSNSGRLDFLVREAREEKARGTLQGLSAANEAPRMIALTRPAPAR